MLDLLQELDRICKKLNIRYFLFAGTLLGAVRHQGFIPWDDDLDVVMLREDYDRFLQEADKQLDGNKYYLQKEFGSHWPMFFSKLRLNGTTCLELYHPKDRQCHMGIYIDIFPCDRACKTKIGRWMQFVASKVIIAKSLDRRGYATESRLKPLVMVASRALPLKPFLAIVKGGSKNSGMVHTFLGGCSKMDRGVFPATLFQSSSVGVFEGREYPIPAGYEDVLQTMYQDYMRIPTLEERCCKRHAAIVAVDSSYETHLAELDGMFFRNSTKSIR